MNTTLFHQVSKVNEICHQALPYIEKANELKAQAEKQVVKKVGYIFMSIGIGFFGTFLVSRFGMFVADTIGVEAIGTVFTFLGMAIGAAAGFIAFKLIYGSKKAKAAARKQIYLEQAQEQSAIAQRIFDENIEALSILPVPYVHPEATSYITMMVQSGRANTIPEALALYDEYEHRCNMENTQMAMLQEQQLQTAHLQSIRTTNAINMGANIANAAANIGRIF